MIDAAAAAIQSSILIVVCYCFFLKALQLVSICTCTSTCPCISIVTLYSAMLFYAMKCSTLFNFIINNTITFIVSSHLLLSAPDLFTYTYTYTYIYIYYCCCCYSIVYSYCCSLLYIFKGGKATAANKSWDDSLQRKTELVELLDENSNAENTSCYGKLDVVRVDYEIKNIDKKMNESKHQGKFVWSCILPVDTTRNGNTLTTKERASYRVVAQYNALNKRFDHKHHILDHEDIPITITKGMKYITPSGSDVHEMVNREDSFRKWKEMLKDEAKKI